MTTVPKPQLVENIAAICESAPTELELLERVVDSLVGAFGKYDWVGIYVVDGEELALRAWRGPRATEHVRIPLTQGVCGFAASEGETVVVDDVNADPRYLACFPNTKSEIVVPISAGGHVLAEIDIDSDRPSAFTDEDVTLLEAIAQKVGARMAQLRI